MHTFTEIGQLKMMKEKLNGSLSELQLSSLGESVHTIDSCIDRLYYRFLYLADKSGR